MFIEWGACMKKNILLKTNLIICSTLVIGFLCTAVLGYQANYQEAIHKVEQVSSLSSEGIYYQMISLFTKPVNISLTMANDHLLKSYLDAETVSEDTAYVYEIRSYLSAYKDKYQYDSVFLVSEQTKRYYNDTGIDRVLSSDHLENEWYERLKDQEDEYFLVVDNDEVLGADNALTIFVNCKILDDEGTFLGAIGVGVRVDELQHLLKGYERDYAVDALLVNQAGEIQISAEHTGYENVNHFEQKGYEFYQTYVNQLEEFQPAIKFWTDPEAKENYVVMRSIPDLDWILLVECDTTLLVEGINKCFIQTVVIVIGIIALTLLIITKMIQKFNQEIMNIQSDNEERFRKVTEQLYDNIYEWNITKNCSVGESTLRYTMSLGAPEDVSYEEALYIIAEKQIKEEFRAGYISTFSPKYVQQQFDAGVEHLCYDFMITKDGKQYEWMRIDARLFWNEQDDALHMLTYRKDIDREKRKEEAMYIKAQTDEMTKLYTKTAIEKLINHVLKQNRGTSFAFLIFDIDNFKTANDTYGHVFGDGVIKAFAHYMKAYLPTHAIIGRIGGDEFAALIPVTTQAQLNEDLRMICNILNTDYTDQTQSWHISASIGVSVAPSDGNEYVQLYEKADIALYETKKHGKDGFTFYRDVL